MTLSSSPGSYVVWVGGRDLVCISPISCRLLARSHFLSGLLLHRLFRWEAASAVTWNHILILNLNVYRVIQIPEWMIKVKMFALALYDILLWMIFNQHVNVYEYQTRQWRRLRWSRRRSPPSCCCTSTLSSTLASALAAGNFFVKTRSHQSWRKVVTYMWCLSLTTKVKSYKNSMKQPKRPTSVIYVLWCFKPELLLFKTG